MAQRIKLSIGRRQERRALAAANRALTALGQATVRSLDEVRPLTYSDVYGPRPPVKRPVSPLIRYGR